MVVYHKNLAIVDASLRRQWIEPSTCRSGIFVFSHRMMGVDGFSLELVEQKFQESVKRELGLSQDTQVKFVEE